MTRISDEERKKRQRLGESRTDWKKFDAVSDADLDQLIADDPDEGEEILQIDWSQVEPVSLPSKKMVNLRLDEDVLEWFRAGGKGYQTRINAVLRSYYEQVRGMQQGE